MLRRKFGVPTSLSQSRTPPLFGPVSTEVAWRRTNSTRRKAHRAELQTFRPKVSIRDPLRPKGSPQVRVRRQTSFWTPIGHPPVLASFPDPNTKHHRTHSLTTGGLLWVAGARPVTPGEAQGPRRWRRHGCLGRASRSRKPRPEAPNVNQKDTTV